MGSHDPHTNVGAGIYYLGPCPFYCATFVLSQKMFLKEKRENISVLPRRELSILLRFSNLGRIENPYGFSQFRYLRQNPFYFTWKREGTFGSHSLP